MVTILTPLIANYHFVAYNRSCTKLLISAKAPLESERANSGKLKPKYGAWRSLSLYILWC